MRAVFGIVLAGVLAAASISAQESSKPAKQQRNGTMGISGNASTAAHCVSGAVSHVFPIGYVDQGARVDVTFASDFDPVAVLILTQVGTQAPDNRARATFVADDDTGGNLEPEIRWTVPHSGTLSLHVRAYGSEAGGCYHFKIEKR